jgi:NAD(P)-dependent dehydrogenase (short-subunit alcohol dehydrogenase family)
MNRDKEKVGLDLSGRTALVTGGSRGLGLATAIAMARQGAHVAICGRKEQNLAQAAKDFQSEGLEALTLVANLANPAEIQGLFDVIDRKFGRLDVLVNNAATNILTPSVAEADERLWDRIVQLNLKGTFLASSHAVKLMKKAGGGRIINISSIAARKAARGMGIYCVTKAAVEMLTKVMAIELAQERITVNAVAPCMIKTGFSQFFWANESLITEIQRTIPMGRIAETRDVVGAILFLASDLSEFITGETITVDGGSMAQ